MLTLTILNTLLILIILFTQNRFYLRFYKKRLIFTNTLIGFEIYLSNKFKTLFYLYIPIRNGEKLELKEEIDRMMKYSDQVKLQKLTAIFSWIKTLDDVKKFEKKYSIVDKDIVNNLVSNFKDKL